MGHLTELALAAEGVTFTRKGPAEYQPFGPASRADLREALRVDLERRTAAMIDALMRNPKRSPVIGEVTGARVGECHLCGDPMLPYIGGWCVLCTIALGKAMKEHERRYQETKSVEVSKEAEAQARPWQSRSRLDVVAGAPLTLSAPEPPKKRGRR